MTRALSAAMLALGVHGAAQAATVAIAVDTAHSEVPAEVAQAIAWHALYDHHGHDALVVDLDRAALAMQRHDLTTLYHLEIDWSPWTARVEGEGVIGSLAPRIDVTEYTRHRTTLAARTTWHAQGALALYRETSPEGTAIVALPQVALQDAMRAAVGPVQPPTWHRLPETTTVPVVIAADEEYRAFYGPDWKRVADLRVRRASALLGQAGLHLEVVAHASWTSPAAATDLSALLDAVADTPRRHPRALRIALTQQTDLARAWDAEVEDVGRAYRPGRDLLIADQAAVPDHPAGWDEADEGAAIAHELLHALGVPHRDDSAHLMSRTKAGTVYRLHESSRVLARAAAASRWGEGARLQATVRLGRAADAWLAEPEHQIEYVTGNLLHGPGIPDPGEVRPEHLPAVTNAAIGRYYLDLAARDPENAALWQTALVHSEAAAAQEPAHAPMLAEALERRPTRSP